MKQNCKREEGEEEIIFPRNIHTLEFFYPTEQ